MIALGVFAIVSVIWALWIGRGLVDWPFAGDPRERPGGSFSRAAQVEQEAVVAEQVSNFLRGVFEVSNREAGDLTASEILDRAAERLDAELLDRPRIRVRLMVTLGESHLRLGNYERAEALLEQGLAGTRDLLGEDHAETLRAMEGLAGLHESLGRFEDAEPLYLRLLESRRRNRGGEHPDTLTSLAGLAGMYVDGGFPEKAEPLYREVLETRRAVLGDDHPDTLLAMVKLADFYRAEGQADRLEGMCLRILETRRRVLGEDHPDTLTSLLDLTALYREQGRPNEAASLQRDILEARSRVHGNDDADTLAAIDELARLYVAGKRYEEAEPLYREARETRRRVLGDGHPNTLTTMAALAELYLLQGRHGQAEPLLAQAVRDARESLPEDHLVTGMTLKTYGKCLLGTKRYNEAEEALLDAHEILKTVLGPEHEDTTDAIRTLVELYKAAGAPRMAAAWERECWSRALVSRLVVVVFVIVQTEFQFPGREIVPLLDDEVVHPPHQAPGVVVPGGGLAVAVAFAGVAHVAHRGLADQFQCAIELQTLGRIDARVVRASRDQQRGARLLHVVDRAALETELQPGPGGEPRVDHPVLDRYLGGQPLAHLVADAHEHHAGTEPFREPRRAPGRGVTTVRSSRDSHAVLVGDARGNEVIHAVDQIVVFLAGRVPLTQLGESHATPRAAPIVGVQHGISAGRGDLSRTGVAGGPSVPVVRFGTTVNHQ